MSLNVQHSSTINNAILPKKMDMTRIPADARKFVEAEALSIFTSMTNAGASLQQTLVAVFLSGMNAAHSVGEQL